MAGDWRFQGSAMRRRMGAPSSHLDAANAGGSTIGSTGQSTVGGQQPEVTGASDTSMASTSGLGTGQASMSTPKPRTMTNTSLGGY